MRSMTTHTALSLTVVSAALCSQTAAAPQGCDTAFTSGADTLFIGQSFFVPIANRFNAFAEDNGYAEHTFDTHFSGGASGSPAMLWDDTNGSFTAINAKLATGAVDLLGMTNGEGQSGIEAYTNWIDLALSYNPDTAFFIGQPWAPYGPSMTPQQFEGFNNIVTEALAPTVDQLRRLYPGVRIFYATYGETATQLWNRFDAGTLPDIRCVWGCGPADSLFSDGGIGHAGPMLGELAALTWMEVLYGADPLALQGVSEFQSDIGGILADVRAYNAPLQTPPQDLSRDGVLDLSDVNTFIADNPIADLNADGTRDLTDITLFIGAFSADCT